MKQASKKIAISDTERDIKDANERKRNLYKNRFGRKKYAFPPKDKTNLEKHFCFPKELIFEYSLSMRALAVYPIMCLKADFEDDTWFQIPLEEIAAKSGLSINTVRKALQELEDNDLLRREKRTSNKIHYYVYKVRFIRKDMIKTYEGKYFIFNQSIIDSGIWAKLNLRSKALYLALRAKAFFDPDSYLFDDDLRDSIMDNEDLSESTNFPGYRHRRYDICTTSVSQLCKLLRISSSNIKSNIEELVSNGLIKKFDECYEVYLHPIILD